MFNLKNRIYSWSYKRLKGLYGNEYPQYPAYRCDTCASVITWRMIHSGAGCSKCGSIRCRPSNFTLFEEIRLLFMPWSFKSVQTETEIPQVKAIKTTEVA